MGRFEENLNEKRLELNLGKTKIMRFRKGGDRIRKRNWRWKRKVIEKAKQYKYLRYVIQKNKRQEAQVKDRIRRTAAAVG